MIEYFIQAARAAKYATTVTEKDLIDAKDKHALIDADTREKLEKLKKIVRLIVQDVEKIRKERKIKKLGCKMLFWILVKLYKHNKYFYEMKRRDKIYAIAMLTELVVIYRERSTKKKDEIIEMLYQLKKEQKKRWVERMQAKERKPLPPLKPRVYKRKIIE